MEDFEEDLPLNIAVTQQQISDDDDDRRKPEPRAHKEVLDPNQEHSLNAKNVSNQTAATSAAEGSKAKIGGKTSGQ
jgi:hypothetical protein